MLLAVINNRDLRCASHNSKEDIPQGPTGSYGLMGFRV